jgi:hypothetical protein
MLAVTESGDVTLAGLVLPATSPWGQQVPNPPHSSLSWPSGVPHQGEPDSETLSFLSLQLRREDVLRVTSAGVTTRRLLPQEAPQRPLPQRPTKQTHSPAEGDGVPSTKS